MKKRVLSLFMAFTLCFSMQPTVAFAGETGVVTEQEVPGSENTAEVYTTDSISDGDVSGGDAGVQDAEDEAVRAAQELINALPDEVTAENAEMIGGQLAAIDEALAALNDEQRAELDMTRYDAICAALIAFVAAQDGEHIHPVCGVACTDENGHSNVTWTAVSTLTSGMAAGNYYLTDDVTLDATWTPKSGTVLDLNGHSITVNADVDAITVPVSCSFTLTDCNSSGGVHYFTKNTEKDNLWEPVGTGGDTTVTGGVITHSSGKNGSGIFMGGNGTFTMYGGTICGNYNDTAAGAGVRATQSKIIMPGGAISGNVAANHKSGGGVNLNGVGSSFDMSGNAKITDNTTNGFGGGVHMECIGGKVSFTMSDNAQITGNMCTGSACGGAGLYASGGEFTMNDNAAISDNRSLSERGYGGGVFVSANATFTVNGKATISRNSAYIESTSSWKNNYGGGVLVLGGTFNMNGGSISDNMAENGAGVYVKDNSSNAGTFTMNGGTITNNKVIKGNGGGVYVLSGFEIANDAQVLNNSRQDTSGQVTPDNVYLTTGKTFQINGKLTGGVHSIGVSAADTPADGSPVTIATATTGYTLNEEDADCFTGDVDGIYPVLANNEMQLSTTAPHRHYLCGTEHHDVGDHTTDSQMSFTKLWMDDDGKLKIGDTELKATTTNDNGYFYSDDMCYELPAGNYYLGSSITLDYPIYIASNLTLSGASVPTSNDVKLCLNGNTITANGNFSAIVCSSVLSKTTFTLTDCQQTAGTITHATDKTGSGVLLYSSWAEPNGNGTRFNMYGGSITGNTTEERGGGVNIGVKGNGGIFNLYGGVISNNKANDAGGGVYMDGQCSTFTMYDGEITDNTAGTDGGGVSSANAKFIMNGGNITGNTAATGGGVSVGCYSSTDFTMNGGKIKNNTASTNGGGVYMVGKLRSYTFTLNGTPDISGNTKDGAANNVYLSSDAVITVGNLDTNVKIPVTLEKMPTEGFYVKFAKAGAGLELNDNIARQFDIENDGSDKCDKWIIENDPDELWLYVTGDELHEHAICGDHSCYHESSKHSQALWTPLTYDATTQQLMYGSLPVPSVVKAISAADDQGNPTTAYYMTYTLPAGNYYLADTIEMNGGSITYNGNEVTSKGGVIEIETDVNLCLNGKRISTSAPYVGVIVIKKAGALTLSDCGTGGRISSSCNAFAGVQIANDTSQAGTFTMYDGGIMNTATGVLMGSNSIFNMYDGTITQNETGVSVVSTSKLTVGDSAYIANNDKENVFLYDKAMITIDSSLTNGASVGVTTEKSPTDETPIQIATGASGWVLYTEIFKPDGTDKGYVVTEDEGKLYLNVHIHNWIYDLSADYRTIMATCNVTGCPNSKGGMVTISEPEHEVYGDGKTAEATLNKAEWQADEPSVTYKKGNDTLAEAPTDAGTYTASIILGNKTAYVTYEIKKADPAAKDFVFTAPGSLTYDGKAKTAEVKIATGITGMGDVTVKYYQGETEVQPVNAGEYTVRISVEDGTNYNAASNLTDAGWAFTIAPITTEPTVELSGNMTYTGEKIKPEVTVTIDGKTLTEGMDYTITYGDNVNAGTDAGTVTVQAKGNYGFADFVQKFTIEKADPELSFEKDAVTVTWGDPIPENPLSMPDDMPADVTVTYTSSKESVATVDENGLVTMVGVGTTTITAKSVETTNYKEGTASYTFTVNKAIIRIERVKVKEKIYDGSTTAEITKVFVVNQNGDSIQLDESECTVTGAFAKTDAGEQDVVVTVELLDNIAAHYELVSKTYMTKATISAKPISITNVLPQTRSYKRDDTSVTIMGVTFNDADGKPVTTLVNGLDYTMSGKMADANIGTNKEVTVTVTLQGNAANNYSLVPNTTTTTVTITKAAGGALTGDNLQQKFSDRKQKTLTPDYTGLPADETWTYSISGALASGTAEVEPATINSATGEITYTLTSGAENDTISWTVTISNPNYEDFTKDLVLTLTAKDPQETLRITGDDSVVYGQKLKLSTVGGSGTGEITYSVDASSTGEATMDADGVLTPVKCGSVVITATKAGDADYSEITSAPFVIMITPATPSGEPKYNKITTGGKTLAEAGLTLDGSTLTPAVGTLVWVDEAGNELPGETEVEVNKTYKWCFTPANTNYKPLTGEIELYHVDAPAVTAQPKSVSVITGERAVFEVAATGTDVTYQWKIDRNDGNGFVDITGANGASYTSGETNKSCDGFKYYCVISNAAGSITTDTVVLTVKEKYIFTATAGEHGSISPSGDVEVVEGSSQTFVITPEEGYAIDSLTVDGNAVSAVTSYTFENVTAAHTIAVTFKVEYRIIDGADGSWTQNTDGSLIIRGNGAFSRFLNVKVDGQVIDPVNYTVREGSTIVELKADYLKTLSEGSHTFELEWTDGSAGTSFTVARSTSGGNNNNNNSNTNNNSSQNNNANNNNTTEKAKDPNTGDASHNVLWYLLTVMSVAGLAVLAVLGNKKKEEL